MFGELPKLFDRNFALGYFLPGTIYLVATFLLLDQLGLYTATKAVLLNNLLVGTTAIGLISWMIGILLLGANRSIYRFLEGYGKYNPLKLLLGFEKRQYDRENKKLDDLDAEFNKLQESGEKIPHELRVKRNQLTQRLAERFPDEPGWILPTSFGNIIRAFEVYSRVVYGIEAIQGWNRLLAVIPKDYRELVDDAKSQVDIWVNLGILSVAFVGQYIGLSIHFKSIDAIWLPFVAILGAVLAASRANSAAVQWGELVKSSFDVYLPKLRTELALADYSDDERTAWIKFSQMIIYRLAALRSKNKSNRDMP